MCVYILVGPSVTNASVVMISPVNGTTNYSVTVSVTIHPDSEADMVEVMLVLAADLSVLIANGTYMVQICTYTYVSCFAFCLCIAIYLRTCISE